MREKYILLLTVATFVVFCVGGFFFLPELKAGTSFAYRQIKDAGPDLLGLIPPVDRGPAANAGPAPGVAGGLTGGRGPPGADGGPNYVFPMPITARAKLTDMQRLADKIRNEINLTQSGAVLPRPYVIAPNGQVVGRPGAEAGVRPPASGEFLESPSGNWTPLELPSGESGDPETRRRRDTVRDMMRHGWDNYVRYAWGENELRPISKRGHSPGILGKTKLGESSLPTPLLLLHPAICSPQPALPDMPRLTARLFPSHLSLPLPPPPRLQAPR